MKTRGKGKGAGQELPSTGSGHGFSGRTAPIVLPDIEDQAPLLRDVLAVMTAFPGHIKDFKKQIMANINVKIEVVWSY